LAGFAYRFRLKRQLHLDALYEFLDLTVFAALRALLQVCRLVWHAHILPQAGRLGCSRVAGLALNHGEEIRDRIKAIKAEIAAIQDSDLLQEYQGTHRNSEGCPPSRRAALEAIKVELAALAKKERAVTDRRFL
jgi:hypothetical protein